MSTDELFEFENVVSSTCDAPILAPREKAIYAASRKIASTKVQRNALRVCNRIVGRFDPVRYLQLGKSPNVLLIGAICGDDLNLLKAISNWRRKFDLVAAFVCDCWAPEIYPTFTRHLDHLFVPMPEMVEQLTDAFRIPVTCIPFGANVLEFGSCQKPEARPIDLISFGRTPQHHHESFSKISSGQDPSFRYLRTIARRNDDNPKLDYKQRVDRNDLRQLYKDLSHSKLALCYESVFPGMRPFPHSFLTMRWFEAGAAGCVMVGKRPSTPLADDLLDWENSTIELPSDGEEAVEQIKELLKYPDRLGEISKRNYEQNLRRHDWRWRIKQMLELLKTPVPTKLNAQLQEIEAKYS